MPIERTLRIGSFCSGVGWLDIAVKLACDRTIDGVIRAAGEIVTVDEATAIQLIQTGLGVPADGDAPKKETRVPAKEMTR